MGRWIQTYVNLFLFGCSCFRFAQWIDCHFVYCLSNRSFVKLNFLHKFEMFRTSLRLGYCTVGANILDIFGLEEVEFFFF